LDLKTTLSDFCGQSLVCELILTLVSLWLSINSFKENFKEKTSNWFFWFIFLLFFSKIFWLFYYYLAFWFNQGYNANDRLDFILIVIKRDYNTNDRLKFILSIIRWDNDLNKTVKSSLKAEEKKTESDKMKMKAIKTRN